MPAQLFAEQAAIAIQRASLIYANNDFDPERLDDI
jgi:hypothetical protein